MQNTEGTENEGQLGEYEREGKTYVKNKNQKDG